MEKGSIEAYRFLHDTSTDPYFQDEGSAALYMTERDETGSDDLRTLIGGMETLPKQLMKSFLDFKKT